MNRELISLKTNRLPARLWCKFECAFMLMRVWTKGLPTALREKAFSNTHTISRYQGLIFVFDDSKAKIERQIMKNWCGSVSSQIKVLRTELNLSKDRIRTLLKVSFCSSKFRFHVLINWAL